MLIITRRVNEAVMIGDDVVVTIVKVNGAQVRIGVSAPTDVTVHRGEVHDRINSGEPLRSTASVRQTPGGRGARLRWESATQPGLAMKLHWQLAAPRCVADGEFQ